MQISKMNMMTGQINTMEVNCTEQEFFRWQAGEFVQDAMPNATPTQREFLITGMTEAEQEELFK